jgi:hypothetical protein
MPAFSLKNAELFKQKVQDYGKKTVQSIAKGFHGKVAKIVYNQLLINTPVLTSQARGNWLPSINEPVINFFKGKLAGVAVTGEPMTGDEESAINLVIKELHDLPFGQNVILRNNVPYILRLNNGYSQKAPAGITSVALVTANEEIKQLTKG